jgi:AcrR family transcriptional regulator
MMTTPTGLRSARDSKRDQIVAAATEVLLTQGVEACTVRSIAATGDLSKSAIHYYFEDVNDIITLAFEGLMREFLGRIETAARAADGSFEAVWAAAGEYLRLGSDTPARHRVPMLAFDFHIASTRRGDNATMAWLADRFAQLLQELVAATGVAHAEAIADTLFSALIGTVVRAPLTARDTAEVLATISEAIGIPLTTAR